MKNLDLELVLQSAFEAEERGNVELAILQFKKAAKAGSNDARSKLGTLFSDVIKPPKLSRAYYWYRQGVRHGDSGCAWNLAMLQARRRKRKGYLYWLRMAYEMGDPDAAREWETRHWWRKNSMKIASD